MEGDLSSSVCLRLLNQSILISSLVCIRLPSLGSHAGIAHGGREGQDGISNAVP